MVVLGIHLAHAQVNSGTLIVIGYSQNQVVIAADSRQAEPDGLYSDDGCKIAALSDNLLFVSAGSAKRTPDGTIMQWDATREARTSYKDSSRLDMMSGYFSTMMDLYAFKWVSMMAREIRDYSSPQEIAALTDHRLIVQGSFIGLDDGKLPYVSQSNIVANVIPGKPTTISSIPVPTHPPKNLRFAAIGMSGVFLEYEAGKSARSRQWASELAQRLKSVPATDHNVTKAIFLVELSIRYGTDMVAQTTHVTALGGPVDAVELRAGGKVKWIQRKANCPE
jgi:hypothetical protein